MRDVGRIREKIEIVLDSRQVVSIVLGSAVLLGIVFYLGVTVGKDLAAAQPAPPADPLAELDRQAEALAEKLTFPDSLTDEAAPPMPSAEAAAAAKAESERAAAAEAERALAAAEKAAAEKAAADAERAKAEAEAEAEAAKAAADARAVAAAKPVDKAPAAPKPAAPPKVEAAAGGFTVQVGAMPNRSEADALVTRLRGQGLSPYVVAADIPGKGTFYRVRLGRFASRDEAKRYLADVQRETQLSGFVAQVDG
ncbi:SPOR domain-containing protein [Vulgatibacter sp.]|uniref:SPOR domain-containing protein n=1 Tax=Vulgatibacter sp. TaxID=1971226 RepID=UPI003565225A